jgi:hypothetical protein
MLDKSEFSPYLEIDILFCVFLKIFGNGVATCPIKFKLVV